MLKSARAILGVALLLGGCGERPRDRFGGDLPLAPSNLAAPQLAGAGGEAASPSALAQEAAQARAVRGFIRRGTPQIAAPGRPRGQSAIGAGAPEITLDFQRADLQSVVRMMLEDGLGASYVIDPSVDGEVTFRSNRPLSRAEVLPTLEEILRLNGAALVERDGVFRVLPRSEAGTAAPLVSARDAAARGLTVRVTPLRHIGTEDLRGVLDEFAPVTGSIRYDPRRNLVFTIGTRAEQETLLDLIMVLDVDHLAGRSFALLPLRAATPNAVADELEVMFARPDGTPDPDLSILPVARMNAILLVADRPGLVEEAREFIGFLDQDAGETPRLHIFEVRNRRAGELATILGAIFDAEVTALGGGAREGLAPRRAGTGGVEAGLGLGEPQDDGAENAEPDGAAPLPPADAAQPFAQAPGAPAGLGPQTGVLRITADESTNAIVALATTAGSQSVETALARLDTQPLQVMIEATLVEVQLNDALEFGVRWFLNSGNFAFNFTDVAAGAFGNVFPGFNAAFRTGDIGVTLSALDEVTDVRILSSPTLMVLDNRIARLQVGDQVPVSVRSSSSTDDLDAPIVSETEFRDTGVILEIRPTVNAGGLVVLEIVQEVSAVSGEGTGGNPTIATRVVQSSVAVQSGETIALAGLIEEQQESGRDGIPGLSRIPVVGSLFGTESESFQRSELLVLIRPIVVRDQTEARAATDELRSKLSVLAAPPPDRSILMRQF
ncbi:MAG: type II secretion system secretin GspD [Pikeienuella sp.]